MRNQLLIFSEELRLKMKLDYQETKNKKKTMKSLKEQIRVNNRSI